MNTKDIIRSEALKLFSRKGYDAVGIQEIVDNSGITKPSLYHHFGSKFGLFEDLLDYYYKPLLDDLKEKSIYKKDLKQTLNDLFNVYLAAAQQHQDFFRLKLSLDFLPLDSEVYPLVKKYNEKIFHCVEKIFIDAAKDHGNMKGRHQIYTASFIGLIHTYISLSLHGYSLTDKQNDYPMVKYFMHGIFS